MAVTGTSRRRLRREPSDAIEEIEPSQAVDSSDDDEIEAPPLTRPPKFSKGKKGGKAVAAEEAEVDAEMLDKLGDQPIDKASASKLSGLSEDWKRMRETIHANSYSLIQDVAATMAEFDEDDNSKGVSINESSLFS